MHKSTTTSVLLLSSLVMLAAMPLVNINGVTKANAQGYDEYNYYDDGYSQYPTDDKKYECRTTAFRRLFCKFSRILFKHIKFDKDDRQNRDRDNRTGPKN